MHTYGQRRSPTCSAAKAAPACDEHLAARAATARAARSWRQGVSKLTRGEREEEVRAHESVLPLPVGACKRESEECGTAVMATGTGATP
jgi:hypothetical protein